MSLPTLLLIGKPPTGDSCHHSVPASVHSALFSAALTLHLGVVHILRHHWGGKGVDPMMTSNYNFFSGDGSAMSDNWTYEQLDLRTTEPLDKWEDTIPLSTEYNLSAFASSIQNKIALYKYSDIYIYWWYLKTKFKKLNWNCRAEIKMSKNQIYIQSVNWKTGLSSRLVILQSCDDHLWIRLESRSIGFSVSWVFSVQVVASLPHISQQFVSNMFHYVAVVVVSLHISWNTSHSIMVPTHPPQVIFYRL